MLSYKALEVLKPRTPGLGKALVDALKSGDVKLLASSVTPENTEALKKLLGVADLKPLISEGKRASESGDNAEAVGCLELWKQLESLAKKYRETAKKSEHFKSGGTGDLVLYVRS